MVEMTTEQFAQTVYSVGLLTKKEIDSTFGHFGTRDVPLHEFSDHLQRRGLLTNYQVERLLKGEKKGYFYGDYKALYFVGKGTFARVYRAAHKETGDVVALKVLRKAHSDSALEAERFMREGQMGAKLDHPNIVPVYECYSKRPLHFFVMEFVEGQSLREFVQLRKMVEPLEACQIMMGVVSGLAHAFEMGIAHRDMKLSNVLISSDGAPKIVDFGLASMQSGGRNDYTNTRTIDYATLEKLSGVDKDDRRSDIYFAGCMLYHLLSGKPPISETRDKAERAKASRFRETVPIRDLVPGLPVEVERVVTTSMELDANKRYQRPIDMLVGLRKAVKVMEAGAAQQAKGGNAPATVEESRTILLIESKSSMQDAIRTAFKKRGFKVLVISDASRAFDRLKEKPEMADCLVISFASIGQPGLELFKQMKADANLSSKPIVLLLSKKQAHIAGKLGLADSQRAVVMPIKMADLRRAINEVSSPSGAKSR